MRLFEFIQFRYCSFRFSVQLNKTNVKTFCTQPCKVILDSGNNKIGVPQEHVISINNLIGAQEYLNGRYEVRAEKKIFSTNKHHTRILGEKSTYLLKNSPSRSPTKGYALEFFFKTRIPTSLNALLRKLMCR